MSTNNLFPLVDIESWIPVICMFSILSAVISWHSNLWENRPSYSRLLHPAPLTQNQRTLLRIKVKKNKKQTKKLTNIEITLQSGSQFNESQSTQSNQSSPQTLSYILLFLLNTKFWAPATSWQHHYSIFWVTYVTPHETMKLLGKVASTVSSLPLSTVPLSTANLGSKKVKWKILEINSS